MAAVANPLLILGAVLSAIAALLHVGCIVFGASWYRFFGAGERMARLADAGDWRAAAITSVIIAVLSIWALYALSGAGAIPKLPLQRIGLCAIAAVYSLRGLAGLLYAAFGARADATFWWWSSAICLVFGVVHVAGLMQVWPRL
jgi:hypothetical protein